ncbi:MAG TPA: hypothetical protein PLL15_10680, partial [Syntrophales bacterium]|nr:hypothetical protein [Syntrophales bacterium]
MERLLRVTLVVIALLMMALPAVAGAGDSAAAPGHAAALTFFWIAVILIAAKLSSLVEKIGQPSVLGELVIGVLMGNAVLVGIPFFEP